MTSVEYHSSYAARVRDLCYVGTSNADIALLLGISVGTLNSWREEHPEFNMAWKDGCDFANSKVAASLFKRACGYEKVRWKETKDGMLREELHISPSVEACIFWLINRRPDLWHRTVEYIPANSGTIPPDSLTELEIARRIAFVLAKAVDAADCTNVKVIEHGSSTS